MSSTTIRFRDSEFVSNDLPIELWMLEVARQIGTDADVDRWLGELKDEWYLQATSGFGFGPSPALDTFINTDERRERLAYYFHKAIESLSQRDSVFTPDELSQSGVGGEQAFYTQGLPTRVVIDVGKQFLALIS